MGYQRGSTGAVWQGVLVKGPTPRDDLLETLLRWGVDEVSSAEVVIDAARAAADDDAPQWVVALACLPPDSPSVTSPDGRTRSSGTDARMTLNCS